VFGQAAIPLHDLDWRPVPVDGKAVYLSGWNALCSVPWDRDTLIEAAELYSEASCGIAADTEHVFLDNDIKLPALADEVASLADRELGPTPLIRVGLAPKSARIYRRHPSAHIRSRKLHPLEIMCGSGQIVTFGVHRDTQRPYRWISEHSPPHARPLFAQGA
jgi:hypothetical protein